MMYSRGGSEELAKGSQGLAGGFLVGALGRALRGLPEACQVAAERLAEGFLMGLPMELWEALREFAER